MRLGNSAEKVKHRKGLWSPEEDEKLTDYVLRHGHGSWSSVPAQIGLKRNGKSCRLRWINYLRPGLKRGTFSRNEEEMILSLHRSLGNKWAQIAQSLPGRTDNEIKNHWHTTLKKRNSRTAAAAAKITELQGINSHSTNVSSFSAISTSPKPISIHHNSMLPKVLFEEWLSVDRINVGRLDDHNYLWPSSMKFDHPFDDQSYNVSEDTFLDNEFLSSLEYCDGMDIGIFPDSGLEDNSPLGEEYSNFGCSNFEDNSPLDDHGICNGFRQMYSF